ncbi:MAG: sulfite exporter TauE/SafE family protein [Gammaproteobacteria bacterium]|nr:sulfite exporter TauE/SafE family protein [Gammaproteobacteria bacterium]
MIDATFIIIVAGSFVASVFNAAFSAGGALIILAITSTVLPIQAIVPIHSTLLIGSTVTRIIFFWDFIDWRLVRSFLVGSLVGAFVGARIYVELPEAIIATAISVVMLVAIWLPEMSWRPRLRHPWIIVGFIHSLFSTLFAYGALLHAVVLHANLERRQIIGTLGGCLAGMSIFKITGYAYYGFDYSPYYAVIAAAIAVSFLGTAVGKMIVDRLSEERFRLVYRALITLSALRLLYTGLLEGRA